MDTANKKAEEIDLNYKRGLITRNEQRSLSQTLWQETTEKVDEATWKELDEKTLLNLCCALEVPEKLPVFKYGRLLECVVLLPIQREEL